MITISVEPWALDASRIKLSFELRYEGEVYRTEEIMEYDWFSDESIFQRVVRNAAGKLQATYLDHQKKSKRKKS